MPQARKEVVYIYKWRARAEDPFPGCYNKDGGVSCVWREDPFLLIYPHTHVFVCVKQTTMAGPEYSPIDDIFYKQNDGLFCIETR